MRPLQVVEQENSGGCFVAALATLLRSSYRDAYRIVHGDVEKPVHIINPLNVPFYLEKAGLSFTEHKASAKYRSWRRSSLLIIQWRAQPTHAHAVIWDPQKRKLLDPLGSAAHLDPRDFNVFAVYRLEGL